MTLGRPQDRQGPRPGDPAVAPAAGGSGDRVMDRRAFIGTVTGGLLAAPRAAGAQQAGKVSRVGVLVTANPRVYDGFVDELRRLGYVDGQNVVLDFRNAEGQYGRFPALAAELVRAGADVILAGGGAAPFRAARQATTTIPAVIVAIDSSCGIPPPRTRSRLRRLCHGPWVSASNRWR